MKRLPFIASLFSPLLARLGSKIGKSLPEPVKSDGPYSVGVDLADGPDKCVVYDHATGIYYDESGWPVGVAPVGITHVPRPGMSQ